MITLLDLENETAVPEGWVHLEVWAVPKMRDLKKMKSYLEMGPYKPGSIYNVALSSKPEAGVQLVGACLSTRAADGSVHVALAPFGPLTVVLVHEEDGVMYVESEDGIGYIFQERKAN